MVSDLYLILHKVRGEPAFDIAQRLEHSFADMVDANEPPRDHIWIIPTSGHRAYPCWSVELSKLGWNDPDDKGWVDVTQHDVVKPELELLMMVANLRDHYAASEPIAKPSTRRVPVPAIEDFVV